MAGNLHINVVAKQYDEEVEKIIEPYIYEIVCESTPPDFTDDSRK
jgi:hypothetical protein